MTAGQLPLDWGFGELMAFGSLGLLIASRARTIEAVSGLMNLVMLPMWVLSGIFFSADRFPDARPLVERGNMTDLEVVIQEILQDKIAIDYEASGLERPD